ncbi:MAG: hypothetical protein AAGA59_22630 [Actinomycetota bacterium]
MDEAPAAPSAPSADDTPSTPTSDDSDDNDDRDDRDDDRSAPTPPEPSQPDAAPTGGYDEAGIDVPTTPDNDPAPSPTGGYDEVGIDVPATPDNDPAPSGLGSTVTTESPTTSAGYEADPDTSIITGGGSVSEQESSSQVIDADGNVVSNTDTRVTGTEYDYGLDIPGGYDESYQPNGTGVEIGVTNSSETTVDTITDGEGNPLGTSTETVDTQGAGMGVDLGIVAAEGSITQVEIDGETTDANGDVATTTTGSGTVLAGGAEVDLGRVSVGVDGETSSTQTETRDADGNVIETTDEQEQSVTGTVGVDAVVGEAELSFGRTNTQTQTVTPEGTTVTDASSTELELGAEIGNDMLGAEASLGFQMGESVSQLTDPDGNPVSTTTSDSRGLELGAQVNVLGGNIAGSVGNQTTYTNVVDNATGYQVGTLTDGEQTVTMAGGPPPSMSGNPTPANTFAPEPERVPTTIEIVAPAGTADHIDGCDDGCTVTVTLDEETLEQIDDALPSPDRPVTGMSPLLGLAGDILASPNPNENLGATEPDFVLGFLDEAGIIDGPNAEVTSHGTPSTAAADPSGPQPADAAPVVGYDEIPSLVAPAPGGESPPTVPDGDDTPTFDRTAPGAPTPADDDRPPVIDTTPPTPPAVDSTGPAQPPTPDIPTAPGLELDPTDEADDGPDSDGAAPAPIAPRLDTPPIIDTTPPAAPEVDTTGAAQPPTPDIPTFDITLPTIEDPVQPATPPTPPDTPVTPPPVPAVDTTPPAAPEIVWPETGPPALPEPPPPGDSPTVPAAFPDTPPPGGVPAQPVAPAPGTSVGNPRLGLPGTAADNADTAAGVALAEGAIDYLASGAYLDGTIAVDLPLADGLTVAAEVTVSTARNGDVTMTINTNAVVDGEIGWAPVTFGGGMIDGVTSEVTLTPESLAGLQDGTLSPEQVFTAPGTTVKVGAIEGFQVGASGTLPTSPVPGTRAQVGASTTQTGGDVVVYKTTDDGTTLVFTGTEAQALLAVEAGLAVGPFEAGLRGGYGTNGLVITGTDADGEQVTVTYAGWDLNVQAYAGYDGPVGGGAEVASPPIGWDIDYPTHYDYTDGTRISEVTLSTGQAATLTQHPDGTITASGVITTGSNGVPRMTRPGEQGQEVEFVIDTAFLESLFTNNDYFGDDLAIGTRLQARGLSVSPEDERAEFILDNPSFLEDVISTDDAVIASSPSEVGP